MKSLSFLILLGGFAVALGASGASEKLQTGTDGRELSLNEALGGVLPGDVLVIGEQHSNAACQSQQMRILNTLRARGLRVSVGLEFLEYPVQSSLDEYRQGILSETDFLRRVGWGGDSFDLYRDQVLFPQAFEGGQTRALNAPRSLTGKVARGGLSSLTPDESALLPPGLSRGNDRYFERFKAAMGGHAPGNDVVERYFWAQSIWDETMAWQARLFQAAQSDQVLVIIVGEFHVAYGGGLPDRLRARKPGRVWTLSQVDLQGLNAAERQAELDPHPVDGIRADWIWGFELD